MCYTSGFRRDRKIVRILHAILLDLQFSDLSDQLMRFRLTGPKSSVTLMSVLRPMIECSPAEETRTSNNYIR